MREPITTGPEGTYIVEIAIILLGAFILGYLLRYLLNDKLKSKIKSLELELSMLKMKSHSEESFKEMENNVISLQQKLDDLKAELSNERAINGSLRSNLSSVQAELKVMMDKEAERAIEAQKKEQETKTEAPSEVVEVAEETKPEVVLATSTKDDLKIIEGVGPKIEQILNDGGIHTYTDIVAKDAEEIRNILVAQSPTYAVHNPATWAEQAKLAIAGKWDELKTLQHELKGGKRR